MARNTKAKLIKRLKNKGIPIPEIPLVANLEHRIATWEPGYGYLFRLAVKKIPPNSIAEHIPRGQICWIPNSEFARAIFNTRMVYFLGRAEEPPKGATLVDVPPVTANDEEE